MRRSVPAVVVAVLAAFATATTVAANDVRPIPTHLHFDPPPEIDPDLCYAREILVDVEERTDGVAFVTDDYARSITNGWVRATLTDLETQITIETFSNIHHQYTWDPFVSPPLGVAFTSTVTETVSGVNLLVHDPGSGALVLAGHFHDSFTAVFDADGNLIDSEYEFHITPKLEHGIATICQLLRG
ncbi:MAG: hypothetical protein M3295_07335 [Chloroflexota bacterium]|nr:hypothetical protein [Chloroflexota bacterium]